MKYTKKCIRCDKIFEKHYCTSVKQFLERSKFCSKKCQYYHFYKNCIICNKKFKAILSYSERKYCSQNCMAIGQIGHLRNFKTGIQKNSYGYSYIYFPNHPFASSRKTIPLHRYVVEKYIGRILKKEESVHHINNIKYDNRLNNLYLFKTFKKHISYENLSKYGKINKIKKSNLSSYKKSVTTITNPRQPHSADI